jgi:hypothetical protein
MQLRVSPLPPPLLLPPRARLLPPPPSSSSRRSSAFSALRPVSAIPDVFSAIAAAVPVLPAECVEIIAWRLNVARSPAIHESRSFPDDAER